MERSTTILRTVDSVIDLLGSGTCDAPPDREGALSITDHGLQCAYELMRQCPDDHELQVAGLLHDIGHRFVWPIADDHARAGADALGTLFGERVHWLIGHHVTAKRYLVTTEPDYIDLLSDSSERSFWRQGGPMTENEQAAYEAQPNWLDGLVLRRADEAANTPERAVPPLSYWRLVLVGIADRHAGCDVRLLEQIHPSPWPVPTRPPVWMRSALEPTR
jgi:predicted HD phosphohydrolase